MKICPECSFANEERFPTCVWCNAVLTRVKSTPSPDPNHPEHARARLLRERRSRQNVQRLFAALCYAAVITFLAVFPGMISDRQLLAGFFIAAGVIGFGIIRGTLGEFSAMFLQGAASVALVLVFNRVNFLTSFTLVGHVVLPAFFYQWAELIDDGHV